MATNAEIRAAALAALTNSLAAAGRTQSGAVLRRGRHLACATDQPGTFAYVRVTSDVRGAAGVVGPVAALAGNAPPSVISALTGGTRGEQPTDPGDAPIQDLAPPENTRVRP